MAEKDILGDRQFVKKHGLLMDCGDAEIDRILRIGKRYGLAIDMNFALVGFVDSSEYLDEGLLPRTIFADQRCYPAREQRNVHVI